MDETDIRKFTLADRDWLVATHGALYGESEGFDESFEPLVAGIIDDFIADHDPVREAGWVAWRGKVRLGCIFCVKLNEKTAKLRLFLLIPQARGQRLGLRLLETCMGFAREQGYEGMQLWTHESHRAAGALYARNGWILTQSNPVVSFGQSLVEQTWVVRF